MEKAGNILFDYVVKYLTIICGLAMFISIILQIFTRLFFKVPFPWTDELARFSFIWYCFLGSSLTLHNNLHLGINYFENKMNAKVKYFNYIVILTMIIVFGLVVGIFGVKILSIVALQKSPIIRVPMNYVYAVLPMSGFLFVFSGAQKLVKYLKTGKREDTMEEEASVSINLDE